MSTNESIDGLILQHVQATEVSHMMSLLQCLTQPDTETIRRAEAALKPALKQPASMNVLWAVVVGSTNQAAGTVNGSDASSMAAARHSATLVLRKRLPAHYSRMKDASLKLAWQRAVLQALAVETVRPVRLGLQGVAAALASQTAGGSDNGNTDSNATQLYLEFIAAAASNTDPNARELCFLLLAEMVDVVGNYWKQHVHSLVQLYHGTLSRVDEVPAVQRAAVKALGQLLSYWAEEEEMEHMAPLLPLLLQVAARHVSTTTSTTSNGNNPNDHVHDDDDDDLISTVLDVLYDLAYSTAPALIPHVPITIEFALSCVTCQQLSLRVRDAAALVIATTAEAKPKTLGKQTVLLGHVLDALFNLMQDSSASAAGALFESNPAWRRDLDDGALDDEDDDDDEDARDSPTETSMAQGTLDMLACELPKKYIWPAAYTRCVQRMSSADAMARKAGVAGLGVIAEGCAEPLTIELPNVMPLLFAACADTAPPVRECACFCLGQISEHCQPEILQYASAILPTVFALLDDHNVAVQATSCYVLEMFCERLEPAAVRPVLDALVRKLASMLEVPNQKRSVQEMAVAALAATSVAAEAEFAPYVAGVANLLTPFLAATHESQFSLRGRALECMGHMAIAVGADPFRPYFTPTMQCAMEGLTLNSTDLQEFAYAVFANLAKVMRDEFAPALPDLVPFLIQVIQQEDSQFENPDNDNGGGLAGLDDSDDEDDDGPNGNMVLHVRTALLEVKKGALTALGEMAAHTGTSYCPFIESSMQVLQKAAQEWHPDVRREAAIAFPSLVVPSIAAYHNGEIEWKRGDTAGQFSTALSQHTLTIVHAVLQEEVHLLKDEEKSTVSKACESIQSVIELCGPASLNMPTLVEELFSATMALLTKTAPCYTAELYEDDDEDGGAAPPQPAQGAAGAAGLDSDDEDHDAVTQAVCDLVGAFCRVLGSHFAPYLAQFLPAILDYAKSSRPTSDRSMAVGCLSEIAQECEGAILDYWPTMFQPCLLQALADVDDNVKRNAAFCTGICAEHLGAHISADYGHLLAKLGPIFSLQVNDADPNSNAAACMDNAAACVARMIMACPQAVTPMAQVLPVFLTALPLKMDETENETVYTCLIGLVGMKHADLMSVPANVAHVQRIITQACQEGSAVEEELQAKLKAIAPMLSS